MISWFFLLTFFSQIFHTEGVSSHTQRGGNKCLINMVINSMILSRFEDVPKVIWSPECGVNTSLEIVENQCFRNIIYGHSSYKQKYLQWEILFTPRLKGGDNSSGQEKCALKYVRGKQKKFKGVKTMWIFIKSWSLNYISRERYIDMKSTWELFCFI